MITSYYRLEKTEECKQFFFDNDGYFNFWDQVLILRIREENFGNTAGCILVNRGNFKFSGEVCKNEKEVYYKEFDMSLKTLEPEQMYRDFPELLLYKDSFEEAIKKIIERGGRNDD